MAGATATVGHNRAGTFHHGFPIRVGHVGDQNIAGLHLVHFVNAAHQTYATRANFLPNGSAV